MQGLCRSVGVSNFGIGHLQQLLEYATIVPAVNQIELTPFLQRKELVDFCTSKGIALEVGMWLHPGTDFHTSSAVSFLSGLSDCIIYISCVVLQISHAHVPAASVIGCKDVARLLANLVPHGLHNVLLLMATWWHA